MPSWRPTSLPSLKLVWKIWLAGPALFCLAGWGSSLVELSVRGAGR